MRWLSPIPLRLQVIGAANCTPVALSQEKVGVEKALEKFFELGLPDAKGGKWVRVSLRESGQEPAMPGGYNARYSGNAWLLRDEKGIVEVVTGDGRFVRGRKSKGTVAETGDEGPLPVLQIQPADIGQDMKAFTAALKNPLGGRYSRDSEDTARQTARMAGGSLLFLAQLQRQGHGDFVREALPQVLAIALSPEKALDGAVTLLADAQLANLTRDWTGNGNAAAYAAGINALAAKFPRGWEHRDAAGLLATRLREQKHAALAAEPDAKQAAEFLLKLNPAQFEELPLGQNWFISSGGASASGGATIEDRVAMLDEGIPTLGDEEEGSGKPMKRGGAVGVYFAKKREAALALAKLLDHRAGRDYTYYSSGERKSREVIIREQYNTLSRPYEIGELAWDILSPLLPDETRNEGQQKPATRAALALAWVKSAVEKSDEELAWNYLRGANGTSDNIFRNGIRFLVDQGGPETLAQLREVFFDPGVWNGSSLGELIPHVERYVKRAPADAAFADKLRAAVKAGLDADEAENRTQFSGSGMAEMKKQMAAQRAAQMKQLDRIFKPPPPLAQQLAEILAMEETEALASFSAVSESFSAKPLKEIEAPIFQAAANAKSVRLKSEMLQTLHDASLRGTSGKAASATAAPAAAATREAIQALLRDETPMPSDSDPANTSTVAGITSWALLAIHDAPANRDEWQRLETSFPQLSEKWARARVHALASGKPMPPMPSAAKLASGRAIALVAELGALPAAQIPAALDAKTPDEQLAIVEHLQTAADWPSAIAEAHFSVRKIAGADAAAIGGAAWKGRRLDEKFVREIQTAIENSAAAEKFVNVHLSAGEPLAGVQVSVSSVRNTITEEQFSGREFPGLKGRPVPAAFVTASIQSMSVDDQGAPRSDTFGIVIWKDAVITRSWREENAKPAADSQARVITFNRISTDPSAFENKLRACLSRQKDARGTFDVNFFATGIGETRVGSPNIPRL